MEPLPQPHIVVVDDDPAVRDLISSYLHENEFRVTAVSGGSELFELLSRGIFDLIVLDLRMPGPDGLTIARKLRAESTIPIIVVSGKLDIADRVMALELGADDFLTKPFSPRELLARIRTVLRRFHATHQGTGRRSTVRAYRFSGWELNLRTRRLTSPQGETVSLTNGEFSLLTALLAAPSTVLSRDQLLESSRLFDDVYDRSVDVQILRLRRKIEPNPSKPQLILTERNVGYQFAGVVQRVDMPITSAGRIE